MRTESEYKYKELLDYIYRLEDAVLQCADIFGDENLPMHSRIMSEAIRMDRAMEDIQNV